MTGDGLCSGKQVMSKYLFEFIDKYIDIQDKWP